MFKTLLRIAFVILVFLGVLWIGGASWDSFKEAVEMKNPIEVLSPLAEKLPEIPKLEFDINDDSGTFGEYLSRLEKKKTATETQENTEATEKITSDSTEEVNTGEKITATDTTDTTEKSTDQNTTAPSVAGLERKTTIKIGNESIDMSRYTAINILNWLSIKWTFGVNVEFQHEEINTSATTAQVANNTEQTSIQEANIGNIDNNKLYDDILESKEELTQLVSTIKTINELPKYDYDRTEYEKPVQSYVLDGNKVNRNNYAWKTSKWFNSEDFTYQCPYTGTIVKDDEDKKEDSDFGNLDYDHIVPIKSAHLRGGKDWTAEQRNAFAYDQWVGVDVLNKANRSKSDKGPTEYLPDVNVEDYCYSWLLICSKYNLAMTPEEIKVCQDNIEIALDNGEEVTHLGGHYDSEKE